MGLFANRKTGSADHAGMLAALVADPSSPVRQTAGPQVGIDAMTSPGNPNAIRLSAPSNPGFADILMQAARPPERALTDSVSPFNLAAPADGMPKPDTANGLGALNGFRTPKVKQPFFMADGTGLGNRLLGAFADGMAGLAGQQPTYGPMMMRRAQEARQEAQWSRRHTLERQESEADRQARLNDPQYFMSGDDRVRYDPATNQASTIYDGQSPSERYAAALGYQPGTDEYRTAIQDATLRSNGPTAYDARVGLEGVRQGNRTALRGMPTYRDTHPRPATPRLPRAVTPNTVVGGIMDKQARGVPLSPGEQATLSQYQTGRGGRGGGAPEQVAYGADGHKIVLRGGKWVDAATGKPVG